MDISVVSLIVAILSLILAVYALSETSKNKKQPAGETSNDASTRALQLQAYERLVLLTERIAIPNLISRSNQPGLSARDMQLLLLDNIKQEYDYNASQQIYVSLTAWDAVKKLKEQNMLVINQVGSGLPAGATGIDLNRKLLEVIMSTQNGAVHEIVLEVLNLEAKKAMR